MSTLMQIVKALNMVEFWNAYLPDGSGEILTFIGFWGAPLLFAFLLAYHFLTGGIPLKILRARAENKAIGIVHRNDGGEDWEIMPDTRKDDSFKLTRKLIPILDDKVKPGEKVWNIQPRSFRPLPMGVRYTHFHPNMGHNFSVDELADHYTNKHPDLIYSAKDNASYIYKTAARDAAKLAREIDPAMKIAILSIVMVGLLLIVYFAGSFLVLPQCQGGTLAAAVEVVNKSVTGGGVV